MRKILLYTLMTLAAAGMASCEDFLTRDTYDQIGSDEFWKSETDLELYANGFIQKMIPGDGTITRGDIYADYCAVDIPTDLLRPDGNVSPDNQTGWAESNWTNLRRVNYMLDNMHKCKGRVSDEIYNHYEGVARFWRAYFYWNKVKTFGAVPWYDSTIDSNDHEALYKPRDSREYVMRKILEDIEFASTYCTSSSALEVNSVQITRYVALALKARICLYEGTFRKYHANDPSTGKPWTTDEAETYLRAAVSACNELMTSKKYSLVSDPANVSTQYRKLFTSESVFTQEVIWARVYNAELNATHNLNSNFIVQQYGSYSLTKQFINTYLNLDGSRFTDKPGYEKTAFIDEFENRDYRLMQTVRYPGYTRKNNGTDTRYAPDFGYCVTGYQPIKWVIDDTSLDSNTSPCSTSIPIIRYAEILLTYAEAKCELDEFDETVWNETIKPLRERAGVDGAMPATADPYMIEYFLGTVTDNVLLEIRRERGCELILENVRWDDDMRWGMGKLAERPWYGVYVGELDKAYDMDGDGKDDVCFVRKEPERPQAGITYRVLGDDFSLTDGDSGYIECYIRMTRKWDDKKYVRPIPTTALNDNPALGQNYGWEK